MDEISVKELEQIYDQCDAEGVKTDEELQAEINKLNGEDDGTD